MTFSRCKTHWIIFFLIVIFFYSAAGCGGGESTAGGQAPGNEAALTAEIYINTTSDRLLRGDEQARAFEPDICRDYRIDTIRFGVFSSSDNAALGSMDFNCSSHSGTISNLPTDTELSAQVTGLVTSRPDWFSRADGIVLEKDENRILMFELTYVGDDSKPPELTEVQPSDGAVDVQISDSICAAFSEPLALSSIPDIVVTAAATDTLVEGVLAYDDARDTVCFTAGFLFDPATTYTAQMNGAVQDIAGNSQTLNHSWQITTGSGSVPYYTITVSASAGGSISPQGSVSVDYGDSQSFTMTANAGYYLSGLEVDGEAVSPQSIYTFSNVTSRHTIAASFDVLPQYGLGITKSGSGSGVINSSPAGISCGHTCGSSYMQDGQVILTAEADAGSTFTGWSGGGCSGTGDCTVTVDGAVSISADFAVRTYTITASASAGGSISPQGSVSVDYGDSQSFMMIADEGYYLSSLEVDGEAVSPQFIYTFNNVTSGHTIAASFDVLPQYGLSITKTGSGSGVVTSSPAGISCGKTCSSRYPQGAQVSLAAEADAGSTFTGWSGGGCSGTGGCTATVDGTVRIFASFAVRTYTITASASAGGSISPQGSVSVDYGDSQSFTMTADAGYYLSGLEVDGEAVSVQSSYTFNNVTSGHTIAASFDVLPQYRLSITKTGSGVVTSSPAGISCGKTCSSMYPQGAQVSLTAEADAGSTFTGWSGGGCSGTGGCTVTVDGAISVSANFTVRTYTITASASAGGSISPQGSVSVDYGDSQSFTMTADAGYYLSGLEVDGEAVSVQSSYTFSNVTSGHTIAASFDVLPQYRLSITKTGSGSGVVTSSPAGISCGTTCSSTYPQGAQVSLTAEANTGSTFTGWSGGGCSGTGGCTVTVDAAVSVSADFTVRTYTITASASAGGSISPQGSVSVDYGDSQSFTMTADAGYNLSGLEVDGEAVSVQSSYTFSNVTSGHTIEASFTALSPYSVDYSIEAQWNTGFTCYVTITNNSSEDIYNWTLTWTFADGQQVTESWWANVVQSGADVSASNYLWDWYSIIWANGGWVEFGFDASHTGVNSVPVDFELNGIPCESSDAQALTLLTLKASPPTAHVDNPFVGADGYINPDYTAQVLAEAQNTGGALGAGMARVADYSTAVWLDRIAAIEGSENIMGVRAHLNEALRQQNGDIPVTIMLVLYDLPNRDCAAAASSAELLIAQDGLNIYKTQFIDPIAAILSDPKYNSLRIVVVVEPDSLPNLVTNLDIAACAQADSSGAYVDGIRYAVDQLHTIENVYLYLDIAHSGWKGWDSNFTPAVQLYTRMLQNTAAGVNSIDGFITNTANYTPVEEVYLPDADLNVGGRPLKAADFYEWNPHFDETDYATALRMAFINAGLPSTIGMLIDTSRSGWGGSQRPDSVSSSTDLNTYVDQSRLDRRPHRGGWCNQQGAGIGARPQAAPASGIDAYVWVKPPGESDGVSSAGIVDPDDPNKQFDVMCDPDAQSRYNEAYPTNAMPDAPHAGRWFAEQFRMLVENADPPLFGDSQSISITD